MAGAMMAMMNNVVTAVQPVSGSYVYYDPTTSYSGSGSTLTDLSGNGKNGTLFNSPTYTSGAGAYFTLNGTNQSISTPNLFFGLVGSELTTVEVWVYPTATNGAVFSDASQQGNATGYHASGGAFHTFGPSQRYQVGFWDAGSGVNGVVAGTGSYLNSWKQLVRVYNGTTCSSYLNGVAGASSNITWTTPRENGNGNNWFVNFGYTETTTFGGITAGWFTGRIGVIRIYYAALTAAEVLQNYNATKSRYGL
jgi:hypothetical protein